MSMTLLELVQQAERLSVSEQIELALRLMQNARATIDSGSVAYRWMDIAGITPYPLAGEDAQEWVSNTRHQSDQERELELTNPL
jgi:hypothetical protein